MLIQSSLQLKLYCELRKNDRKLHKPQTGLVIPFPSKQISNARFQQHTWQREVFLSRCGLCNVLGYIL